MTKNKVRLPVRPMYISVEVHFSMGPSSSSRSESLPRSSCSNGQGHFVFKDAFTFPVSNSNNVSFLPANVRCRCSSGGKVKGDHSTSCIEKERRWRERWHD